VRIGIIQSNYIPWRGYFDFIDDVDLFIFHDDLQYTKGDWRNRNRIKTPRGLVWLTVPVHYRATGQLICDTEIAYSTDWQMDHKNQLRANYGRAPYLSDALGILLSAFGYRDRTISQLNRRLIESIANYLKISTPLHDSMDYSVRGEKTDRIIALTKCAGATTYLSGPAAKNYLDEVALQREGIVLEYKTYDYAPYPQQGDGFECAVTILDLIANCGPGAREYLKSRTPNQAWQG
jgi:hypothetical protein